MFAQVNGVQLFYEKTGAGRPMLMLHGNGETHHIFDRTVDALKSRATIYAVDTRGHGQSSPASELHYADMAEDIYAFITLLGLDKPILYGFSDGGIVGLLLAIKYPGLLSRLIISGANTQPNGVKGKWLTLFRLFCALSKSPQLRLMLEEPHVPDESLRTIRIPTCITAGSRDMIREEHTRNLHENIPGSALTIFPGETHSSYVERNGKLAQYLLELLANEA